MDFQRAVECGTCATATFVAHGSQSAGPSYGPSPSADSAQRLGASRSYWIGGLATVAAAPMFWRITPLWSVKKYRLPVLSTKTGLAAMV
jgi:hypothetical protein